MHDLEQLRMFFEEHHLERLRKFSEEEQKKYYPMEIEATNKLSNQVVGTENTCIEPGSAKESVMEEEGGGRPWEDLPEDILAKIFEGQNFRYLASVLSLVCHSWYTASRHHPNWKKYEKFHEESRRINHILVEAIFGVRSHNLSVARQGVN